MVSSGLELSFLSFCWQSARKHTAGLHLARTQTWDFFCTLRKYFCYSLWQTVLMAAQPSYSRTRPHEQHLRSLCTLSIVLFRSCSYFRNLDSHRPVTILGKEESHLSFSRGSAEIFAIFRLVGVTRRRFTASAPCTLLLYFVRQVQLRIESVFPSSIMVPSACPDLHST